MILYDFGCANGHRFEDGLPSMNSAAPDCVVCGSATRRRISKVHIGGMAKAGPSREQMPNTWRAVRQGDRETVARWHELARKREALEERYPELAGDRRPVLAHEGIFADKPPPRGRRHPGIRCQRARDICRQSLQQPRNIETHCKGA